MPCHPQAPRITARQRLNLPCLEAVVVNLLLVPLLSSFNWLQFVTSPSPQSVLNYRLNLHTNDYLRQGRKSRRSDHRECLKNSSLELSHTATCEGSHATYPFSRNSCGTRRAYLGALLSVVEEGQFIGKANGTV